LFKERDSNSRSINFVFWQSPETTLRQIRCFIRKFTLLLLDTILARNEDEFYMPNEVPIQ
jgi:hypothetical protein